MRFGEGCTSTNESKTAVEWRRITYPSPSDLGVLVMRSIVELCANTDGDIPPSKSKNPERTSRRKSFKRIAGIAQIPHF